MQISDPTANTRLLPAKIRGEALAALRPGQELQARVMDSRPGEALLAIGQQRLLVKTPVSLTPGATLQLRVVESKRGLELSLLGPPRRPGPSPEVTALRQALPRQRPLAPLLARLEGLTSPRSTPSPAAPPAAGPPPSSDSPSLPPSARVLPPGGASSPPSVSAPPPGSTTPPSSPGASTPLPLGRVRRLLQGLPTRGGEIDAETIRRAFQESGLFLEANLVRGRASGDDLKLALLRLLRQLRGAVPHSGKAAPGGSHRGALPMSPSPASELLAATEGGVARLLVHQLSSLPTTDSTPQVWQFDLPLRTPEGWDNLLLRFEKEARSAGEEAEPPWSVTLELALEELGPLRVRLRLVGDTLSAQFTASRPDSARRIGEAMPRLSERLRHAGLEVGRLQVAQGETAPPDEVAPPPRDGGLLSEKA